MSSSYNSDMMWKHQNFTINNWIYSQYIKQYDTHVEPNLNYNTTMGGLYSVT